MKAIFLIAFFHLLISERIFRHSFLQQEAIKAAQVATSADTEASSNDAEGLMAQAEAEIVSEPSSPDNDPLIMKYMIESTTIYFKDYYVPTHTDSSGNVTYPDLDQIRENMYADLTS
ncbi:unnamed protein product [Blepharisma stoltei]|uniref:Uncharacterized protein n=1 Tax=Blepharisma stoltei TaxID=1481888 RepID=A0AAU9JDZ6_9CILI|nr:unnamed protein product [Blepharisma stoltei]